MHIFTSLHASGLLAPLVNGHAYLDPGTGSFLLQLIIATALGAVFLLRGYISRGVTAVRRLFSGSKPDQDDKQ